MSRDLGDDRDAQLEALLRDALHEEAGTVVPAGDGLSKIQHRVRERRFRRRWMVPAAALGSAVVLAGAGVGAYALVHGIGGNDTVGPLNSTTPSVEPTTASPSPSEVPPATNFPDRAIFPFTSVTEEKNWEDQNAGGHSPWEADAKTVAQMWVHNILEQPSIDKVIDTKGLDGDAGSVTLGRVIGGESSKPVPIVEVQLVKYGNAWIVVGADDPAGYLTLTSPNAGDTISSPVAVTGPGFGVDESMKVDVRAAESPTSFGTGRTGFGNGTQQWSVDVDFTATGSVGVVAAVVDSAADGGPQRIAVEQVRFGQGNHAVTVPQYFYGVDSGRIAEFASKDGSLTQYLTQQEPGGGPSDPQLSDDGSVVYYLQGAGTCANALVSVAVQGHGTDSIATPEDGYVITGYDVVRMPSGSGQAGPAGATIAVAYYEKACNGSTSPQAKLVMQTGADTHTVAFKAEPPALIGDPAWEPDGQHLDAYVRTGNLGYLARYDATSGSNNPTPRDQACSGFNPDNGMPDAIDVDGTGQLWIAVQTGSSMDVLRCTSGQPSKAFTIPGNDTPADIDVTGDGSAILLTDVDGKVWRWDGGGAVQQLSTNAPLDHATW